MIFPRTGFDVEGAVAPPFGLLTIAAPLQKEGYNIKIIDQRTDANWKSTLAQELKKDPLCIAVSAISGTQIAFGLDASKFVRKFNKDLPIIWGGTHATILPEQTLENENIDIVVHGEGDITFSELVKALEKNQPLHNIKGLFLKDKNGKITSTGERPLMDMEQMLPTPWELINVPDYIYKDFYMRDVERTMDVGQTSRGCPFKCGYCCSSHIRKVWRPMSAKKSAERIINDVRRFNLDSIWIRDDNFFVDMKRATEICKTLIKEKVDIKWYSSGTRADAIMRMTHDEITTIKKAGSEVFKIGAESGSPRVLKLINKQATVEDTINANKKAKKYDIIPAFSFIGGFPTETYDELMQTIDCMIKLKKDNPAAQIESMCIYTAYPGTLLYPLAIEYGLKPPQKLEEWATWGFHDFNEQRNPWLNSNERRRLGNICYISTLACVVKNLTTSMKNPLKRSMAQSVIYPMSSYYQWRFNHKLFNWAPEISLLRYIRHQMLDKIKE